MITVKCPNTDCPASFQVPDEYLGKSVRCKKCNTKFKITNNNGFASKQARQPTAVAKTLYETTASMPALPPVQTQAPPQEENADAARKHLYLYLGLGAGGVFSCLAVMCVVGIAVAWSKWGSRPPEIYGGIEISSTTVKASVVKFYADADGGFNYEFVSDDAMSAITNMDRITPAGELDPESFESTATAVSKFFKDLQNKHSVAPDKIVIVAASGVFKLLDPAKAANAQDKLRNRVLADTKHTLEIVDPERELKFQIKSLIPEKDMDRALLVDLGNSDCRGGNYDATLKRYNVFNTKVGVKGFLKKAEADAALLGYKKSKTPANLKLLATAATKSEQKAFREPLSTELNRSSSFNGRKRIELIGGIAWATATYKNPAGRANKHTKLKKDDFDSFYQEIRRDFVYPHFTMPKGIDESLSKKLSADVEKMEERIPIENLIAGTEMMKVLSEELIFQNRDVYFNNNGQKALVLGLMAEMWEQGKK